MTDIFESLTSEHHEVERLFDAYRENAQDSIAHDICDALTVHAAVEEQVFYPAVRKWVDDGDDLANRAEDEHGTVRALIARVYEAPPIDVGSLLHELHQEVRRHVQWEEAELFPQLQDTNADFAALGTQLDPARAAASSRRSGRSG